MAESFILSRTKLQNIFRRYLNIEIPTISDYCQENANVDLIKPTEMSKLCAKLLENKNEYNLENMEDRIQWIKKQTKDRVLFFMVLLILEENSKNFPGFQVFR